MASESLGKHARIMSPPRVFVSYSYDNAAHQGWVRRLSSDLRAAGIDVTLDQWDLKLGQDTVRFMSSGIASADYVLLVCTQRYAEKSAATTGGVSFEGMIIGAELANSVDVGKFVPVFRDNSDRRMPTFIGSRWGVDFNEDQNYDSGLEELARHFLGVPASVKPELGSNPFLGAPTPRTNEQRPVVPAKLDDTVLETGWFQRQQAESGVDWRQHRPAGGMEVCVALRVPINRSQIELLSAIEGAQIRTFGWPIGAVIRRDPHRPKPVADGVRARIVREDAVPGVPLIDYWALRSSGEFYLQQSLFEDQRSSGKIFFNTRIVRVAEVFMFAARLYAMLGLGRDADVAVRVAHFGLEGRELASSTPARHVEPLRCEVGRSSADVFTTVAGLDADLLHHVHAVAAPLFALFDFADFEMGVYESIVTRFRSGEVS